MKNEPELPSADKTLQSAISGNRPARKSVDTHRAIDESSSLDSAETMQAHLFCVLERARPLAGGSRHSLANIRRVTIGRSVERELTSRGVEREIVNGESGRRARRVFEGGQPTLLLQIPDPHMSNVHACLELRAGSWSLVDRRSTNGARVNGRRVAGAKLKDGDVVELGQTLFLFRRAAPTPVNAVGDVDSSQLRGLLEHFGTLSPALARQLRGLAKIAQSNVSVLLEGETGVGKEVLARGIHASSGRPGPLVAVNCAALPRGLVEALFFGYDRRAFPGAAADQRGFIRAADGGTLLLDEIGDLPAAAQPVLLRALQEGEVTPLGSTRTERVDVRFIATTHRSLSALADAGAFRRDLLARLAQFTCRVPPLRERPEDLGLLVASILRRIDAARSPRSLSFSRAAACHLIDHHWPMNVRELEHALKVGLLLANDDCIDLRGERENENLPPGRVI